MFSTRPLQNYDGEMRQDMVETGSGSSEGGYDIYITDSDITLEDESFEDDTGVDAETIKSLAFVAVWDPADDVLFLSHPNSDRGSFLTAKPGLYPSDPISELQSLNNPSVASSSRSSVCYQSVREDHGPLFSTMTLEQRSLRGMTQTSSTLGGLDVYLKGAALALTHRHQPVYSVLDFSTDFQFDASSVGVVDGRPEGTYVLRRSVLQLTAMCDSPACRAEADSWSTIESPTTEELESMGNPFDAHRSRTGRRLKKRRPSEFHAPPAKEHSPPAHSHCTQILARTRLFKGFLGIGKLVRREDSDWVWVEAQSR
ncbi:hypothetical protein BJ912DRAFT_928447 [Pholiota molesta]|nr:hypothetical protein BJ912DRAFT_928447 [Pholiota molesta]